VASGLPYVNEVAVVGVEDEEFGQRVGAIVALKPNALPENRLGLDVLRRDLRKELASYKLPTLLRVLATGELPKGGTGKIQKKTLGPELFPSNWRDVPEVQRWDSLENKRGGDNKRKLVARL
jgi:malonyl-CoA/methylmalonyl-CoA synthetase